MSGRGRGRGRGRGTSQARLMLQKSAAEAGVDERSAVAMARPAHYPDMLWHSSGRNLTEEEEKNFKETETVKKPTKPLQFTRRTTGMTFLVRKQRHVLEYFRASPQHIQYVPPHMDITRYHDNGKNNKSSDQPDKAVRNAMGKKLACSDHLPDELLGTAEMIRRKNRKRRRNADGSLIDLDEFEKKEKGETDGNSDEDDSDDGLDMAADDLDEDDEEEDNHDYTTNYYESEGDDDGGDDGGEAVF